MKRFITHTFLALGVAVISLFSQYSSPAAEPLPAGGQVLLAKYSALKTELENNQFGIPLSLESREDSDSLYVDVYGIYAYPFNSVIDAFKTPDNLCDMSTLLMNVKAATFQKVSEEWQLTLYNGRKYYQSPNDAFKMDFSFHVTALQPEYFNIQLTGNNGPLGIKDQRANLEAIPLDKATTFIHFRYDYSFGLLVRAATTSYYATIGSDKKGFSVIATDKTGDPVYVNGARGSLERNAVRAYFAIQTYMDALEIPDKQRFEKRINGYYDLTLQFKKQLYEMDKGEYLAIKRREHTNQLMLQKNLVN